MEERIKSAHELYYEEIDYRTEVSADWIKYWDYQLLYLQNR